MRVQAQSRGMSNVLNVESVAKQLIRTRMVTHASAKCAWTSRAKYAVSEAGQSNLDRKVRKVSAMISSDQRGSYSSGGSAMRSKVSHREKLTSTHASRTTAGAALIRDPAGVRARKDRRHRPLERRGEAPVRGSRRAGAGRGSPAAHP